MILPSVSNGLREPSRRPDGGGAADHLCARRRRRRRPGHVPARRAFREARAAVEGRRGRGRRVDTAGTSKMVRASELRRIMHHA